MIKAILLVLFMLTIASARAQSDCSSIMRALMRGQALAQATSTPDDLIAFAKGLELAPELIDEIVYGWDKGLSELPKQSSENWLLYVKTLLPEKQMSAMKMMKDMHVSDSKQKVVARFQKIEKKIEKKYQTELDRTIKRLQKKNPNEDMSSLVKRASEKTRLHMKTYRRLSFECRSKTMNDTRKKAASTFKRFTIGIGIVSSFGGMAYANRDNELEDWIGQFGYETVMGIITGSIASKIISNPRNSDLSKAIKKYFFSRGTGLVDMALFGMLFGADEDEAKARLSEVLSDPKKAERLRELQKVFEDKKLYQQVRAKFVSGLTSLKERVGLEQAPPIDLGVDWGNLTEEDLAREDVQDVLMAAAIAELYAEGEGGMIATGNVGADRYAFHAAYGLVMLPKDMATTMWIYNILCLGMANPKTALVKATAVYAINRIISDQLYYTVRRGAINQ